MKNKLLCLLMLEMLFVSFSLSSEDGKFKGWKKAETEHFTFVYEPEFKAFASGYAEIADDAWNRIGRIYGFPLNKINVYVTGRTNIVNAFTNRNTSELTMFTSPFLYPDFTFRHNWMDILFTHELIHAANFSFESKSNLMGMIFGSFFNVFNTKTSPNWAIEGLTTVLETELTAGGRGRSPIFELKYKAPTLDNGFMSFDEIGLMEEPPYDQIYVMGYLIMRSIADRFGINALADIERNVTSKRSFEDSVLLVTGERACDIYRDVRIALAKKYENERNIPEGKIITLRDTFADFYMPAFINDDGTFIVCGRENNKEDTYVYKVNPSDKEPYKKLFRGSFHEECPVTADAYGNIYASMAIVRNDRQPGMEIEYAIFKWNEKNGLKRLTKKTSLFQPTVSRDGKTLVAIEQDGLFYKLVIIDVETGTVKTLLKEENKSFIEPRVNADGSKVAFIIADGKRGQVASYDTDGSKGYTVFVNRDGEQTVDPCYPSWNSDGKLLYSCNARGRLEVFEVDENGESFPAVADPIGVLWAYRTEKGIYYASYSSSGYVIKMKPCDEWKNVPSFNGPSMPGDIITFGSLEVDYPGFAPYEKDAEEIKQREEEFVLKAQQNNPVMTELSNEKTYFALTWPFIQFPLILPISGNDDKLFWGIGYNAMFVSPMKQLSNDIGVVGLYYYPSMNNFAGMFSFTGSIGDIQYALDLSRFLQYDKDTSLYETCQEGMVLFDVPLYRRQQGYNYDIFDIFTAAKITNNKKDTSYLFDDNPSSTLDFSALGGLQYSMERDTKKFSLISAGVSAFGEMLYSKDYSRAFGGFESILDFSFDSERMHDKLTVKVRYADFPAETDFLTSLKYDNKNINAEYPGRIIGRIDSGINLGALSFCPYAEHLFSFGTNSFGFATPVNSNYMNFTADSSSHIGLELGLHIDLFSIIYGYSFNYDWNEKDVSAGKFYFDFRVGGF